MPCCTSANPARPDRRAALLALALIASPALRAADAEAPQLALKRQADGLYLSARLPLEISPAIEDVLRRGVPLHFLWQAELVRSRWYWTDRSVASAARTVRLAYQPLTRRWRLSYATGIPSATGLQYAVHQNFDSLTDALAGAGRVSRWKIAEASRLSDASRWWSPDGEQRVDFSFALDLTQLPRPFQLGLFSQRGWNLALQRTLAVPERPAPEAEGGSAESQPEGEK